MVGTKLDEIETAARRAYDIAWQLPTAPELARLHRQELKELSDRIVALVGDIRAARTAGPVLYRRLDRKPMPCPTGDEVKGEYLEHLRLVSA